MNLISSKFSDIRKYSHSRVLDRHILTVLSADKCDNIPGLINPIFLKVWRALLPSEHMKL
jgi:hypothetical protein